MKSILAGLCIGLGSMAWLMVENKIAAAVLFCIALLSICYKGYDLFTGKAGYYGRTIRWQQLLLILLGNFFGTFIAASLAGLVDSHVSDLAANAMAAKLLAPWWSWCAKAFFCGIIMYLAVSIYNEKQSPLGILVGIPTFLLCGFEHSIADLFYWHASHGAGSWQAILFLVLVIIGNFCGSFAASALESHYDRRKLLQKHN